ncbi:MAG: ABC transporter substrate-binding protein, partial [Massilia sp.]|nr:ABC transporter substrate-binding protein [Massilia sp.]
MKRTNIAGVVLLAASLQAQAAISVKDDSGATVTVAKPAQRVISLAPHVTELLFAAGGGSHV